jgi:hypothetical protein
MVIVNVGFALHWRVSFWFWVFPFSIPLLLLLSFLVTSFGPVGFLSFICLSFFLFPCSPFRSMGIYIALAFLVSFYVLIIYSWTGEYVTLYLLGLFFCVCVSTFVHAALLVLLLYVLVEG